MSNPLTTKIDITRKIEFDAGHRIPHHGSKCRNIHGHRYVLEATLCGWIEPEKGQADDGMVLDFGDLKDIMNVSIGDQWDHAFLVDRADEACIAALKHLPEDHRTVILDCVPTVENLVVIASFGIDTEYRKRLKARGLNQNHPSYPRLVHVRLYETPNCWADWRYR